MNDTPTRIRTHRQNKYFCISNQTAQNHNLSFESLGLLTYCLSMPDDWDFYPKVIWKQRDISRNRIYEAFSELIEKYHCIRIRLPNPKAKHLPGVVSYEIFDEPEECKKRIKELEECDVFLEHGDNFKKCFRRSNPGDTEAWNPNSRNNTKETEETKETSYTNETATEETASPVPLRSAAAENSSLSSKKQQEASKHTEPPLKSIYPCLECVDIPHKEKRDLTVKYEEITVSEAVNWTLAQKSYEKSLLACLRYACKNAVKYEEPKKKMTPFEELSLHFKHGEKYNNAECHLKPDMIGFIRTMKHGSVKFKDFCWDKFQELCISFGIEFDRNSKNEVPKSK